MTTHEYNRDQEIVARYTDQPSRMPADLRAQIGASWGSEPVQLYALADLDASMQISRQWVALGPTIGPLYSLFFFQVCQPTKAKRWRVRKRPSMATG